MSNFRNALHAQRWETVLQTQNCNEAFGEFWEIFQTLFNLYFPLTRKKFNKKIHNINGYMTKGLLISRKNKLKLYKNFTRNKTDENFQKFKRLYYQHRVNSCKSPKMVWEAYNELINKNTSKLDVSELKINNVSITDDQLIAEQFNQYFSSVGEAIAESISNVNIDPLSYLNYNEQLPSLNLNEISQYDVIETLKSFESKKASIWMESVYT
jgi:hypothetical protein